MPTTLPFASAKRSIDWRWTTMAFFASASAQDCDAVMKARSICSWMTAAELNNNCWVFALMASP